MKKFQNEGKTDRVIRLIVAIAAAIAAYYTHGSVRVVLMVVAAIGLISGLSGFALPYKIFGISTKK